MAPGDATPRVDVGIPTYRRAQFLAEAVESVLAQTFADWRLTICENGQGGGTIEDAVRPYLDDPRVAYRASGREITLAENWTAAIQGTAPYVGLLNDDDRWHPRFLEARVAALEEHPECGFAFSGNRYIDQSGEVEALTPLRFEEGVVSREVLARHLIESNVVAVPTIVVRRAAYETVGSSFDPAWRYCDWEMWARLASRYSAYHLRTHDTEYRRHELAYTSAGREEPEALLAMLDLIRCRFEREIPDFHVGRIECRRTRSSALLSSASSVYLAGGGWRRLWPLYQRALREYPPMLFRHESLQMIGRSLIGRRRAGSISRALRRVAADAPAPARDVTTEAHR